MKGLLSVVSLTALICMGTAFLVQPAASDPATASYRENSFATDPQWEGVGNRPAAKSSKCAGRNFAFGWSRPARTTPQGEIGGLFARSSYYRAYYAEVLPQPKSLNDPLTASGTLRIEGASRGGVLFGWFNSEASFDWRTPDFLGIRIDRLARGALAYGEYGTTNTFTDTTDGYNFASGREYTWALTYDPNGGSSGTGLLRLTIGGGSVEVAIRPSHRADGADFDRFGFLNAQVDGPSLTAYVGNLTLDGEQVDLAHDPGWEGSNNHLSAQDCVVHDRHDFGYSSSTQFAGVAGEIGGLVWRSSTRKASYADLIATLGLQDPLYAEGSIDLEAASSDSDVFIGWFNTSSRAGPGQLPTNIVAADLGGPSEWGYRLYPVYRSSGAEGGGFRPYYGFDRFEDAPLLAPKHHVWRWWICYRPTFDEVGNGRLTVGLADPAGQLPGSRVAIKVKKPAKDTGAVFNRFGIRNFEQGGHSVIFYLDDLRYTVAPGDVGPDDRCG